MREADGHGTQIGAGVNHCDATASTRHGKRYGVDPKLLERNRFILKDYYNLVDKSHLSKAVACSELAKKYSLSPATIRQTLAKMRNR